jgi:hypothetical protein
MMYAYTHKHIHTQKYPNHFTLVCQQPNLLCMHACVCVCVCTYIYIYIYIHTYTYTCILFHTYTHTHTHKHTNIPRSSRLHVNTQICYACIYTHTYTRMLFHTYTHTHIHIHIHTHQPCLIAYPKHCDAHSIVCLTTTISAQVCLVDLHAV